MAEKKGEKMVLQKVALTASCWGGRWVHQSEETMAAQKAALKVLLTVSVKDLLMVQCLEYQKVVQKVDLKANSMALL